MRSLSAAIPDSQVAVLRTIQSALESAGVEFIAEEGAGAGVRLRTMSDEN
jgi:hypothetical protein